MDQFKHLDDSTIYDKLHSVSRPSASRVRNKKAPTVYRSTGPSTFLSGCVIRSEAVILPLRRQSRMRSSSSPVSGVTMPVKVNCASVFRAKPYRSVACVCRKHTSVESAYSAFHNTVDNSIILISFEQHK